MPDTRPIIRDNKNVSSSTVLVDNFVSCNQKLYHPKNAISDTHEAYVTTVENNGSTYILKVYKNLNLTEFDRMYETRLRLNGCHNILVPIDRGQCVFNNRTCYFDVTDVLTPIPSKLSYDRIRDLNRDITNALIKLKELGFVHRDIKPGNIMMRDNTYVLIDYGTLSPVADNEGENAGGETMTCRNSVGYTPMEGLLNLYSYYTDVHALAFTLATLYLGHHPYQSLLYGSTAYALFDAMKQPLVLDSSNNGKKLACFLNICKDKDKNINVEDMNSFAIKDRLEGKFLSVTQPQTSSTAVTSSRSSYVAPTNTTYVAPAPVKNTFNCLFNGHTYNGLLPLCSAMMAYPDSAKALVFRGGVNNSTLINALLRSSSVSYQAAADKIKTLLEGNPQASTFGLSKAMFYLEQAANTQKTIFYNNIRASNLRELTKYITTHPKDVLDMLKDQYLSFITASVGFPASDQKTVSFIEKASGISTDIALEIMRLAFGESVTFKGYKNAKDYANHILELAPNDQYLEIRSLINDNSFYALCLKYNSNLSSSVFSLLERTEDIDKLTDIYSLLSYISDNDEGFRNSFCKYSHFGYIYAISESAKNGEYRALNIMGRSLISYVQKIYDKICECKSIASMHKVFSESVEQIDKFIAETEKNPAILSCGILPDNCSIWPNYTSSHLIRSDENNRYMPASLFKILFPNSEVK